MVEKVLMVEKVQDLVHQHHTGNPVHQHLMDNLMDNPVHQHLMANLMGNLMANLMGNLVQLLVSSITLTIEILVLLQVFPVDL